ncbi:MAG: hypothetical protein DGJ47_000661 [Rickettsiaceae bacterium]
MVKKLLLSIGVLFLSLSVYANEKTTEKQGLIVKESWARTSIPPNNNSAAYMKITNPNKEQITIIGASAAMVANNVELHKSFVDEKGISRMTSIDKIVVPGESTIELAPGAIHIMLFDLKKNLSLDDKFKLILKLEGMKPVASTVVVKN